MHLSSVRARLVTASALMLFTELLLIRWLGANLLHLSYFSNIVLLGSFLGIGLGFLMAKPGRSSPWWAPLLLAALVVVVRVFPVGIDRSGSDLIYFTSIRTTGSSPVITLTLVFVAVAAVMAGLGLLVAQCFLELPRLEAYRYDLLGSLLGTVLFAVMSFLSAPPIVWSVFLAIAMVLLVTRPRWVVLASLAVVMGVLAQGTLAGDIWSPYYKIQTITRHLTDSAGRPYTAVGVLANGVPHQSIVPVDVRLKRPSIYSILYDRIPDKGGVGDVLIVGAGSGTDVAIALSKGATSVDAVEIDPSIHELGVKLNPDKPFADPRVHSYISDGRAFLHQTHKHYDLVIFALPDSLTLVAGSNQLRLESYLFTEEAMKDVRRVLKPGGAFAMYNYYREDWLIGRLVNTVVAAFGHKPTIDIFGPRRAAIVVGLTPSDQVAGKPGNGTSVSSVAGPAPVHDDRPFLYLKGATIPGMFLEVIALIIVLALIAVRAVGGPLRRMAPYADLACLGAAFLLLETRAVTWSALLFGTTWLVNAIVFAGVLVAVLLAVELTRHLPVRPSRQYAFVFLAATLLVAWLVPTSWLLSLAVPIRVVVAVAIAFGPVFASNIVFATRFNTTEDATGAFAANLLGAMVGGCLEYLSLIVGYRALLLLAGLLYVAAFALGPHAGKHTLAPQEGRRGL